MAKQKMIQEETSLEMVPADDAPKAHAKKGPKSKVNMILPTGTMIVAGEPHDLSAEDLEILKKAHPKSMKHIIEDEE